jgi:formylglycine-generating enzyme required for sulfatase activity
MFIARVNNQLNCGARLPTEAEWEYACRAGTTTAYFWGNALNGDKANCAGTSPCGTTVKGPYRKTTVQVGSYPANAWGFCDMHGNVWEWCNDWFGQYPTCSVTDPLGSSSGVFRVLRGSCFNACDCRSAFRLWYRPGDRRRLIGFRLCCSAAPQDNPRGPRKRPVRALLHDK